MTVNRLQKLVIGGPGSPPAFLPEGIDLRFDKVVKIYCDPGHFAWLRRRPIAPDPQPVGGPIPPH